jgi:hypothetical protein
MKFTPITWRGPEKEDRERYAYSGKFVRYAAIVSPVTLHSLASGGKQIQLAQQSFFAVPKTLATKFYNATVTLTPTELKAYLSRSGISSLEIVPFAKLPHSKRIPVSFNWSDQIHAWLLEYLKKRGRFMSCISIEQEALDFFGPAYVFPHVRRILFALVDGDRVEKKDGHSSGLPMYRLLCTKRFKRRRLSGN